MGIDANETLAERKQRLEEEVETTKAALEKEEKMRKELEALNSKLLQEKQQLLASLEGEKGELSSISERAAKLQAQKNDLDLQLQVSTSSFLPCCVLLIHESLKMKINLINSPYLKVCKCSMIFLFSFSRCERRCNFFFFWKIKFNCISLVLVGNYGFNDVVLDR